MRIGAHPARAFRRQRREFALEAACVVEQLLGPIALHPGLKDADVLRMAPHRAHRHLVRAPVALLPLAVDLLRTSPALRSAHNDHRPHRAFRESALPRVGLNPADVADDRLERRRHELVHQSGVVALDEMRRVSVSAKKRLKLLVTDARQHRGIGDLVAVEMQDRQHRAVAQRIEKLVGVPARRKRSRLRFAVADDRGDNEVRIVKGGAVGVRQRVAEFPALVDRTGRLGSDVAWDPAGK